jgi:hypothetical protein
MFDFNQFWFKCWRLPHVRNSKGFAGGTEAKSRPLRGTIAGAACRSSPASDASLVQKLE